MLDIIEYSHLMHTAQQPFVGLCTYAITTSNTARKRRIIPRPYHQLHVRSVSVTLKNVKMPQVWFRPGSAPGLAGRAHDSPLDFLVD